MRASLVSSADEPPHTQELFQKRCPQRCRRPRQRLYEESEDDESAGVGERPASDEHIATQRHQLVCSASITLHPRRQRDAGPT